MRQAATHQDPVPDTAEQRAYSAARAVWYADHLRDVAAGAYRAPAHLQPGLQGHLFLEAAMPLDQATAEAA